MKKKTTQKTTRKAIRKKPEKPERQGMNIKQMVVRSAIREGFRVVEIGGLALVGALMGLKISF